MKNNALKSNTLFVALLLFSLLTSVLSHAQAWRNNLPQSKINNGTLTLFDYQKAFNTYWEPYNLERGYYYENGEKIKAGGWKQFKRWEWYWESRVDPNTGEFPTTTAWQEFQEYLYENPGSRSPSGNWTSLGPNTTSGGYAGLGRLNCVAFRPTDNNTLYVGAASGGVWKSTDGGMNWTPLGDDNAALGVSDIVVIKTNFDDIVYIATGDRDHSDTYSVGVLKSVDGGLTWNTTGLNWTQNQYRLINRLLMDPSNNNVLYAATSNGVYKTTDAGVSWNQMTGTNFIDIEFQPGNSSIIYGSTTSGTIYRSTNSGSNWSLIYTISGGYRTQLAVSANNSSYVYAVSANSSDGLKGIYRSTDGGASFSLTYSGSSPNANLLNWDCNSTSSGGQGWYDLCIASDPANENIVFVGGVNTWKSADGGFTWNISTHWSGSCGGSASTVHADKHFYAYQPGTSTLYECNDGGLYKTSNGGNNWQHLGSGLVTSQIYRLGVGQTSSAEVIIGLQDNGTKVYSSGSWSDEIGGDGMDCLIDFTNHNIQYGELYYGSIYRTTNHWGSSSYIASGISGSAAWVTPFTLDPSDHNTIYVGFQDVWKRTFPSSTWTKLSNWNGSTLKSIAVAPSDNAYIYTATYGSIYRTANSGANWSSINSNLPSSNSITFISVKNDDPNTAWVSFSGFSNNNRVYQTTNGGSSWTNISTGLPQLPVNCIIQNNQNTTDVELYAGTDVGIYVKVGNANWVPFFDGLPNVVVTELEIYYDANPANSLIRAATFGRGVWESDLYSQVVLAPDADFMADILTPTTEQTVNFSDLSTNSPTSWTWSFTPSTITYLGGTNSASQNPQVQFDAPGTYTVALTATNAGGSDTETKPGYIIVTYPAPIADFTADNLTPTTNDTVTFTDASTNFPDTWLWTITPPTITFTDGTDQNSQNPNIRFDEPGIYTVELLASNDGGSDNELKTDYIVVTYPAPIVDFSADKLSPTTIDQVIFTDLSTYFPYAWTWSFSPSTITFVDGTDQNSQNPKVLFDQVGLYSVELTATNDGGDGMLTKIDYINVREALSVTVSATPDEICFGGSAQLVATPAGGTGTYAYIWTSNPSGFNSMEQNPVVSPLVTTVYTVEVSDGEHSVNADVEILVDQLPVITLGDWPELLCNQEEPPVQLTAIPEGGIYSGDNVTSNGLFSPEEASIGWHVITYSYEDENGCESSKQDSIYVDNCVGIHSNQVMQASVMIFPNPNKGTFTIQCDHLIQNVEIVNMLGEVQYSKSAEANSVHFNTRLVKGMYIIHIFVVNEQNDSRILKKKIVIN